MEKQKSIKFKKEIYGFEKYSEYTLSKASESKDNPFMLLKSLDDSINFILLDPKIIDSTYEPILDEFTIQLLEAKNPQDIHIFGIVVIPNDIKRMTINLRSPIIINIENGNAIQLILEDDRYSIRHRIIDC